MKRVRLSPRAAADLEEIGDYIAHDNPERAITFVDELQNACTGIADNPQAYSIRLEIAPGIRMAIYGQYVILFQIRPSEIRVERILHGARDLPRAWRS